MRSFIKDFRDFIRRGNVVDLAVAVVIGAAFGKVVSSFVDDIMMPPLGYAMGMVDFTNLVFILRAPTETDLGVVIRYGKFISVLIDYIIVSFAVYIAIRVVAKMGRRKEGDGKKKKCPECAMEVPVEARLCCHCASSFK